MRKITLLALACLIMSPEISAQFSRQNWDSIRALTQADYNQMLSQLGIDPAEIRPGPSGPTR